VLGLDETAALPGRLSEPPMGIPSFDVAVVDYELADDYPNPIGGIERPPSGARVLFVLVRATNVTPLPGRPPHLAVVRDALPDETIEGWLCRVVPSTARVTEISVAADRRLGVRWRPDPAAIAP
jgi:hypothetical protein